MKALGLFMIIIIIINFSLNVGLLSSLRGVRTATEEAKTFLVGTKTILPHASVLYLNCA